MSRRKLGGPFRRLIAIYLGAGAAFMLVLSVLPWHQPLLLPILILPALAFIAEFLPVEISRGVRLTFPLPFLAAMAVAAGGPLPAALTDLGVTLAAALAIGFHKKLAIDVRWL